MTNTRSISTSTDFQISDWREYKKGTLAAFLTIETPSGMQIHDCTYHVRDEDNRRWIGLPSRSFKKENGETGWKDLIEFKTKECYYRFRDAALAAIDRHLKGGTK